MKVFLIAAIALCAVSVSAHDKEKYMLKKWAVMKAFEGCLGKDVTKMYMVKVKTAISKCKNIDAPELEFPMFQNGFRTVSALVNNGFKQNNNEGDMQQMLQKYAMQKLFAEMSGNMKNDDEYRMAGGIQRRFRRDAHHNEEGTHQIDLGDRLSQKLQNLKMELTYQIGNYSCMLRECGVFDSSNTFQDVETLVTQMNEYPVQDKWLKEHIEDDVRMCHSIASSLPEAYLNECFTGPEMAKVKCYKKCLKMRKMKTCMNFDIKQQLEGNFGPLEKMVKQTKIEEDSLLPLVQKLLHGDMMEDM